MSPAEGYEARNVLSQDERKKATVAIIGGMFGSIGGVGLVQTHNEAYYQHTHQKNTLLQDLADFTHTKDVVSGSNALGAEAVKTTIGAQIVKTKKEIKELDKIHPSYTEGAEEAGIVTGGLIAGAFVLTAAVYGVRRGTRKVRGLMAAS